MFTKMKFSETISFLGHEVSAAGIAPDSKHVERIKEAKPPTNRQEVESFVGLVNYFGRMIPNFASKLQPINELRQKDKCFEWTAECQQAFETIVNELSSKPLVQPYSLAKEVTITTDASERAIGAVLTQEGHPVIYISKTLTAAEQNYSNIEREAYAIVYTVTRLRQFLLGRKFSIVTDHKPLQYIFHPSSEIPKVASARIARWAITLMAFDFEIKHAPGTTIGHADALSRLRFNGSGESEAEFVAMIGHVAFEQPVVDIAQLRAEVNNDVLCKRIIKRIRTGNWSNCSQLEADFSRNATALTIHNGLIYLGTRLYIPARFRQNVLNKLHETHTGMVALKKLAKLNSWWPRMDTDIEQYVRNCQQCATHRPNTSTTLDKWPLSGVWERLHIDWLHLPAYGDILIIVDAGTGWIEAFLCPDRSTKSVIKSLRTVFTRFGIPYYVVSDNAKEFVASDLSIWLNAQGCSKIETPTYNPQSNGLAERAVKTVKKALKFFNPLMRCSLETYLQKILFSHHNSATSRGKTPAELLFGRVLRVPVANDFNIGEKVIYKANTANPPKQATYIVRKGRNTAWLSSNNNTFLASENQIGRFPDGEQITPAATRENIQIESAPQLAVEQSPPLTEIDRRPAEQIDSETATSSAAPPTVHEPVHAQPPVEHTITTSSSASSTHTHNAVQQSADRQTAAANRPVRKKQLTNKYQAGFT